MMKELSRFNANRDWPCSECKHAIKAGSDYIGEYGDEYGYKRHLHEHNDINIKAEGRKNEGA